MTYWSYVINIPSTLLAINLNYAIDLYRLLFVLCFYSLESIMKLRVIQSFIQVQIPVRPSVLFSSQLLPNAGYDGYPREFTDEEYSLNPIFKILNAHLFLPIRYFKINDSLK